MLIVFVIAYTPETISIGPFHSPHGTISDNNKLLEMEELKLKYLKGFLNRTELCMDDLVLKVQKWENKIRNCYAGPISFDSDDFLKIIIVDACFIIEHFLRCFSHTDWMHNDPIIFKPSLNYSISRDLVLIENQLPFFVLQKIYNLADINQELPSFITITLDNFKPSNPQNINSETLRPKHFIDLLRTFLLPPLDFPTQEMQNSDYDTQHVYSTSQLSEAGFVFELHMPCFHVHDLTEMHMRNIIAFEECHLSDKGSAYITQYFNVLDFLIDTEKDVRILVDKKIIVNWMSDANAVATMVNNLCKNSLAPPLNSNYLALCNGLNGFYENPRNKYKAIFVHEYFNTPWKITSTLTAVFLVLFTLIQAVCSIWSLVKSYKDMK
ncbi:hypothetical protein QL285_080068 [Trifolium repens]|nr:hypothetical protein QL285_080068 [Trifolium repens]